MNDAPEQIWVEDSIKDAVDLGHGSTAWPHPDADWPDKETEYVRADQLDAALAANRELVRQLAAVRKAKDAAIEAASCAAVDWVNGDVTDAQAVNGIYSHTKRAAKSAYRAASTPEKETT